MGARAKPADTKAKPLTWAQLAARRREVNRARRAQGFKWIQRPAPRRDNKEN